MPSRPGGHGAVELGHIQIDPQGALCACGNRGCLETFVSERVLRERGAGSAEPLLRRSPVTRHCMMKWQATFTTALANAVNLLTPDLIVLGGILRKRQKLSTRVCGAICRHGCCRICAMSCG